jgi:hypothetical protein
MTSLLAISHIPGMTGLLVITTKLKAKYRFIHLSFCFMFYKKQCHNKSCIFSQDVLPVTSGLQVKLH